MGGFGCWISAFEVYKEQIFDLLENGGYKKPLKIGQNQNGDFTIENISEVETNTLEEMVDILVRSDEQRHFAETYLEHLSSRSHMGFKIRFILNKGQAQGQGREEGSITFIDLAGCEKINEYSDPTSSYDDFGYGCSPMKLLR